MHNTYPHSSIETVSYTTPHGGDPAQQLQLHPAEMVISEHPDGSIEVSDPLFEEPYRIGDRSLITDPVTDDFVRTVWDYFGVHMSTRQLARTELFETIPSLGRWNRMQHTLGVVAMTARFGGTPAQIAELAVHDLGHRVGSHRFESLIENRLADNDHEDGLVNLLERSGFVAELRGRRLCDEQGILANGMLLTALAHSEDNPLGITNWPARTGFPETERLNYILTEKALWQTSPEEARRVLATVRREPDSPYGDQLVFTDADAAASYAEAQLRCRTEHWVEPVTEVAEGLTVALMRYALGRRSDTMEPYASHHPGDSLRCLEEDWQQALLSLQDSDPGVRGILTVIDHIIAWRRAVPTGTTDPGYREYGPLTPGWLTLFPASAREVTSPAARVVSRSGGRYAVVSVQPGKPRPVNPLVVTDGSYVRLLDARPDIAEAQTRRSHWVDKPFDAVMALDNPGLGLSAAERRGIARIISPEAYDTWQTDVLCRPLMDTAELTARTATARSRYRRIGVLPLVYAA